MEELGPGIFEQNTGASLPVFPLLQQGIKHGFSDPVELPPTSGRKLDGLQCAVIDPTANGGLIDTQAPGDFLSREQFFLVFGRHEWFLLLHENYRQALS